MNETLFDTGDDHFTIESHGVTLLIERLQLPGFVCFRAVFSSKRKPIVIARARDANASKFWTAIPEGQDREVEAEGVGQLIETHYINKNK
jgi:hypothetical protein